MCLFNYLNPGDDCSNNKLYDMCLSKCLSEKRYTKSEEDEFGPKPKISAKQQLFIYLSWLKNVFTLAHVSFLFQTPKATFYRYIITWTNFLKFSFSSIPIWHTREQINEEDLEKFKRMYPSTRCILDCTERYCQRFSSCSTQISLYSHYKNHATYKGLIGVSLSASIAFVSKLYDGSTLYKEIVKKSGLLEKKYFLLGIVLWRSVVSP